MKGRLKIFAGWVIARFSARPPDFVIGGGDDPYLLRWHLIPRNPLFNVYLHQFLRSDDDRALHDHPWANVSVVLKGGYWEVTDDDNCRISSWYGEGRLILRLSGKKAHRLVVENNRTCWTLFITGPRYRNWGFHCPQGWVRWQDFTDPGDKGGIGKGCAQ